MEVYADEAQKREYVTNTIAVANNDIEHFFTYEGREKLSLFLYKKCIHAFMMHKKSSD